MKTLPKRTPKEWDETCRHCGGCGKVHKRETFELWTPEEYTPLGGPIDISKYDVPPDTYFCTAQPGATIFKACAEGVKIANVVERPVAFEFNEKVAICYPNSVPFDAAKKWWLRAYGCTYEEDMANR